jgi:hypothetical protein
VMLQYVFLGHPLEFLSQLPPKQAAHVRRKESFFKRHPKIEGWLLLYKKIRYGVSRWLVCQPLPYRWDIIAMVHDVMGHPVLPRLSQLGINISIGQQLRPT